MSAKPSQPAIYVNGTRYLDAKHTRSLSIRSRCLHIFPCCLRFVRPIIRMDSDGTLSRSFCDTSSCISVMLCRAYLQLGWTMAIKEQKIFRLRNKLKSSSNSWCFLIFFQINFLFLFKGHPTSWRCNLCCVFLILFLYLKKFQIEQRLSAPSKSSTYLCTFFSFFARKINRWEMLCLAFSSSSHSHLILCALKSASDKCSIQGMSINHFIRNHCHLASSPSSSLAAALMCQSVGNEQQKCWQNK